MRASRSASGGGTLCQDRTWRKDLFRVQGLSKGVAGSILFQVLYASVRGHNHTNVALCSLRDEIRIRFSFLVVAVSASVAGWYRLYESGIHGD